MKEIRLYLVWRDLVTIDSEHGDVKIEDCNEPNRVRNAIENIGKSTHSRKSEIVLEACFEQTESQINGGNYYCAHEKIEQPCLLVNAVLQFDFDILYDIVTSPISE